MDGPQTHNLWGFALDQGGWQRKHHTCPKPKWKGAKLVELYLKKTQKSASVMSIKFQLHAWLCTVPAKLMQEFIQKQIKHRFISYSEKVARETLLSFVLRVLGNHFNWENTASLQKDSIPKHTSTHLSFIPVCCLVHRHCWVDRRQLIGVRLHPDPAVEPQRQEVVHNLRERNKQHLWISLQYTTA